VGPALPSIALCLARAAYFVFMPLGGAPVDIVRMVLLMNPFIQGRRLELRCVGRSAVPRSLFRRMKAFRGEGAPAGHGWMTIR